MSDKELTVEECRELFKIKPLEWEWNAPSRFNSHDSWIADVLGVRYLVARNKRGEWWWQSGVTDPVQCASPEEGKQLAEAHWQEYIKQALLPVGTSE